MVHEGGLKGYLTSEWDKDTNRRSLKRGIDVKIGPLATKWGASTSRRLFILGMDIGIKTRIEL